jgi:outer membrane protein assembly factor BamB
MDTMRTFWSGILICGLLGTAAYANAPKDAAKTDNWPQFRGVRASGVSEGKPLPEKWDVEKNESVLWKTAIPGLGHSSPIVWGDKIFVTTAISGKENAELKVGLYGDIASVNDSTVHQWKVYCVDKNTGKILWDRVAIKGVPKVARHTKSTHASSTMATDGKHVVAFFGSEGLYCYDMAGKLLWKKDFGTLDAGFYLVPSAQWGFASSPIIHNGRVIVQCDVQKSPFLASLDVKTGKEIWRTPREDVPTWGSPTIVEVGGRPQIIVNGWKHIGGYDLPTGKEIWRLKGGGDIPVPTPVYGNGLLFITNAHGTMAPIYAIKPESAGGDITLKGQEKSNTSIAWFTPRDGAYMQTPVVYGDYLYVCRDHGLVGCYEAKTGKRLYNERLGTGRSGFTASAVAGDGKLYFTSEDGDIYVVQAGPQFKLLSTNSMEEVCMATPAISNGVMFWRTQGHLVAIGKK